MCALLVNGYSIKPHCAVGFSWDLSQRPQSKRPETNEVNGVMSEKSKSRLRNAINWMVYLSENKFYRDKTTKKRYRLTLNMITLTLCAKQMHTDEYIYHRLVRPFLKWLTRKGLTMYVWRAEAQSNGNIHFHITGNRFVDKDSIRLKWNSLLQAHGYIREYIQTGGDESPPSTHVTGNKTAHKLASYLIKYMSKSTYGDSFTRYLSLSDKPKMNFTIEESVPDKNNMMQSKRRNITCKQWGCSTVLSQQRRNISELDLYYSEMKGILGANCKRVVCNDHFVMVYDNNAVRDYAFKLQSNSNHVSPVHLLNESIREKRISGKLGKCLTSVQTARPLHVSTLFSQTERKEKRAQRLLPCHYSSSTHRPQTG